MAIKVTPITKKRKRWAQARRDVTLKGTRLNFNAALQEKFVKFYTDAFISQIEEYEKAVRKIFRSDPSKDFLEKQKEIGTLDASMTSNAKRILNKLNKVFENLFSEKSILFANKLVDQTSKVSSSALHTSMQKLTGGLSLKTATVPFGMEEVAKAIVQENSSLIISKAALYRDQISESVYRSITTGSGLHEVLPFIENLKVRTKRQSKQLALDQTRKAYNTINKQRMLGLGIKQFEWLHSGGGQEPRKSHEALSGKIFCFTEPTEEEKKRGFKGPPVINAEQVRKGEAPIHGIPGQAINCKCTMGPVIQFEDEEEE